MKSWLEKYENGGEKKRKRTIKVFAESPKNIKHRYDLYDDPGQPIPKELEKLKKEVEISRQIVNSSDPYTLKQRLKQYIDGYYLSYDRPSTKYQGDPYTTGFRAGTQSEPYYNDPNNTREEILEYLNRADYSTLQEDINDIEP